MAKGIFNHYFTRINAKTSTEALQTIGADFNVEKRDIFIANEDNENHSLAPRAAGFSAIVRTDTEDCLGVVSAKYGIVQYKDAVKTTDYLIQNDIASYFSGFTYSKGRRMYLAMTDNSSVELEGGLKVKSYFTLISSHDGTYAFTIIPTFVREDTGSVLTFDSSGKLWTKHSANVGYRVENLHSKVNKIKEFFSTFSEMAKQFATIKMNAQSVDLFTRTLVPGESTRAQNIRDRIISIYHGGTQAAYAACNGTLLGCYLAFVEYAETDKTVRMSKKIDFNSSQVNAALSGEAAKQKAQAFAHSITLAKNLGVI